LRDDEREILEKFAKFSGQSVPSAIKQAAIEQAADQLDYELAARASDLNKKQPNKNYSYDDFRREFLDGEV
jgi:uncharacterized protein (DUF1778 family)